jgi:hypothetical protein
MKPRQQKRVRHSISRPTQSQRAKATVPPRRPRRPRPTSRPAPQSASLLRGRVRKPVCPTAQRAYEAEMFAELE